MQSVSVVLSDGRLNSGGQVIAAEAIGQSTGQHQTFAENQPNSGRSAFTALTSPDLSDGAFHSFSGLTPFGVQNPPATLR